MIAWIRTLFSRPLFRNRFNIGSGLLLTATLLAWPWGRPSYVTLETWWGLEIPWWFWPSVCVVLAGFLFRLPARRGLVVAFVLAACLFSLLGVAVALSVGPGVLIGAAWTSTLGCMRIALDLKTDLQAQRALRQRSP